MRFGAILATAAFALSAKQATGTIDNEPQQGQDHQSLRGRSLVETSRGLWVENQYIASVRGEAQCQLVREEIKRLKAAESFGIATDDEPVEAIAVNKLCFVPFKGSPELVSQVEQLEGVEDVDLDLMIHSQAKDPPSWGLNRIDQSNLPLSKGVPFSASHTGKGVNVYIIDTGLNVNHVEFAISSGKTRARLGGDFINESPKVDKNGHGSHCAGTAVGATYGIARDAIVYGVKVLGGSGSGSTSGVINGVNWAVRKQRKDFGNKPAVLSLSLGGGRNTAMDNAVKDAADAGHIVVVAAGNENQNACNVSPARAGGSGRRGSVITVGATTSTDSRARYSNYGKCVDIFAPGSSILSAWKGSADAKNTISGTSMATPHVAGVAALLLEKHAHDKSAAVAELFSLTVPNAIRDAGSRSPNLLLQVPLYTGPPTMPTPQPTMPPTHSPVTLCVNERVCAEKFAHSLFGKQYYDNQIVQAPLAVSTRNKGRMCTPTNEDFTGKFVMVSRGDCLFFDKVKNAEKQGAVAVIIYLTRRRDYIFPPAYYGSGKTSIPSLMIDWRDGKRFKRRRNRGKMVLLGSKSRLGDGGERTEQPSPTPSPTPNPTYSNPLVTPKPCRRTRFNDAEKICAADGMTLCSAKQVKDFGDEVTTCRTHRRWVWTSETCAHGRGNLIVHTRRNKQRCRNRRRRYWVQCCRA